jgi:hypothetical protein
MKRFRTNHFFIDLLVLMALLALPALLATGLSQAANAQTAKFGNLGVMTRTEFEGRLGDMTGSDFVAEYNRLNEEWPRLLQASPRATQTKIGSALVERRRQAAATFDAFVLANPRIVSQPNTPLSRLGIKLQPQVALDLFRLTFSPFLLPKLEEALKNYAPKPATVTILNLQISEIKGVWRAAGCAGIYGGFGVACNEQVIKPGETKTYQFKKGTSLHQVAFAAPGLCDSQSFSVAYEDNGADLYVVDDSCQLQTISGRTNAAAKSRTKTIVNQRGRTIQALFLAPGCFGLGLSGRWIDVCKTVDINPGDRFTYEYPLGTSGRFALFTDSQCTAAGDNITTDWGSSGEMVAISDKCVMARSN